MEPTATTTTTTAAAEDGYHSPIEAPPGLYVKALYDYTSDDRTSLSFRQGDIIQVLNQLETGWWDGVIADVRGWFPSNYCAVVAGPDAAFAARPADDDLSAGSATDDDYDDALDDDHHHHHHPPLDHDDSLALRPVDATPAARASREEAAFWIPQATADGRLFYYNTLTGYSTMELPLETPTSPNEAGPRNRANIYVPDHTRAPPDMTAFEDDYDGSASEAEGESLFFTSNGTLARRRRSALSDAVSPSTSLDSL
ncbi:cell division cycle- protein, partial [Ophidiomyces ophidiicola]